MFAGTDHTGGAQAGEKFAGVKYDLFSISRDRACAHHATRRLKREVEDGSEIDVESQRAAGLTNDFAVFPEKFGAPAQKDTGCRGCCAKHVAKAVHASAFKVHASEERLANC